MVESPSYNLTIGRQRQEDHKVEASLRYTVSSRSEYRVRLYLKNTKKKQSCYSAKHRHGTAESAKQPAAQLTVQQVTTCNKVQPGWKLLSHFSCYRKKTNKQTKKPHTHKHTS